MTIRNSKFTLLVRCGVFAITTSLAAGAVVAAGIPGGEPPSPDFSRPERPFPPPPLPGTRIEAELAFIKTALKLTDRQMAAWEPVADAMRARAKRLDAEIIARRKALDDAPAKGPVGDKDLITHLQEMQHAVAAEADDLAKLLAVVQPLYAMLTPEQRDDAGELLAFPPHPPGGFGPPPPFGGPPPMRGRLP